MICTQVCARIWNFVSTEWINIPIPPQMNVPTSHPERRWQADLQLQGIGTDQPARVDYQMWSSWILVLENVQILALFYIKCLWVLCTLNWSAIYILYKYMSSTYYCHEIYLGLGKYCFSCFVCSVIYYLCKYTLLRTLFYKVWVKYSLQVSSY